MIYVVLYALFCIAFAKLNQVLIDKGKRIFHALNGLIHLAAAAAGWYFFGWQVGVGVLIVARLVFDVALNLFRGLKITYTPKNPKSIIDTIEHIVFGTWAGWLPKVLYLIALVALIII